MAEAAGFWSYVHKDNNLDGGRVRRLADYLKNEYEVLTGENLNLFVDRDAVEWGDDWRARIQRALAGTTFFIPIVTPHFFLSHECRKELLAFVGAARSLGLEELLLPILYVDVPALTDPDPGDEAVSVIAQTQWEDWTHLRLVDEDSAEHRKGVNRLAQRIVDISQRIESIPTRSPSAVAQESLEGQDDRHSNEEDDAPGYLDLIAIVNERMSGLAETVQGFGPAIESLGAIATDQTAEMNRLVAEDASMAARLAAIRRVAEAFDPSAEELKTLGADYASQVLELDPTMLTLFTMLEDDDIDIEASELSEFLDIFVTLAQASRSAGESLMGLIEVMDPITKWSRDLRRPLKKAETGLRSILDAQGVLDEWESRARRLS